MQYKAQEILGQLPILQYSYKVFDSNGKMLLIYKEHKWKPFIHTIIYQQLFWQTDFT